MFATPVSAHDYLAVGAKATTWRVGDSVFYPGGCHAAEPMVQVAENASNELFILYVVRGECFIAPEPMSGVLVNWVGGPYQDNSDGFVGSVWEIRDFAGEVQFIWLKDDSGSHRAAEARGA